jgi:ribosomal protein S18 acetylase RimI-like enzyme
MTVEISRVGPADTALLSTVAPEVFDEPIRPDRLAAYLADPSHLLALAVDDGVVVGMIMGVIHRHPDKPNELYVDEVGVTPSHQRRGIARRLMDEMVAWAREHHCEETWLGTEPDNTAANALYARYATGTACTLYSWDLDAPSTET